MSLVRYARTRLRGWYALAMAGRGRSAPPAPELDARIVAAIRAAAGTYSPESSANAAAIAAAARWPASLSRCP